MAMKRNIKKEPSPIPTKRERLTNNGESDSQPARSELQELESIYLSHNELVEELRSSERQHTPDPSTSLLLSSDVQNSNGNEEWTEGPKKKWKCTCNRNIAWVIFNAGGTSQCTGVFTRWMDAEVFTFQNDSRYRGYHTYEDAEFAYHSARDANLLNTPLPFNHPLLTSPSKTSCQVLQSKRQEKAQRIAAALQAGQSSRQTPAPLSPPPYKENISGASSSDPFAASSASQLPLLSTPKKLSNAPLATSTAVKPLPTSTKSYPGTLLSRRLAVSIRHSTSSPFSQKNYHPPSDMSQSPSPAPLHNLSTGSTRSISEASSVSNQTRSRNSSTESQETTTPVNNISDEDAYWVIAVGHRPGVYHGITTAKRYLGRMAHRGVVHRCPDLPTDNKPYVCPHTDLIVDRACLEACKMFVNFYCNDHVRHVGPRSVNSTPSPFRKRVDIEDKKAWYAVAVGPSPGIYSGLFNALKGADGKFANVVKCFDEDDAVFTFVDYYMTHRVVEEDGF